MQHACQLVRGGGRAVSGRMRLGSPYCGQGSRDGFSSFTVVLERGGRGRYKQWGITAPLPVPVLRDCS